MVLAWRDVRTVPLWNTAFPAWQWIRTTVLTWPWSGRPLPGRAWCLPGPPVARLLLEQAAGAERMFTEPSLGNVSPSWGEGHGRMPRLNVSQRWVFSPPQRTNAPDEHTGIAAVKHDVMTSGRVLKHSRPEIYGHVTKVRKHQSPPGVFILLFFAAECFQPGYKQTAQSCDSGNVNY